MNFGQLQTNLKLTWTNLANWNHLEPTWNQLGNNLNQFCNLGPTWATLGRQLSCDQLCSSNDACLQWFSHFFMIFASSGQISLAGWPLINYKFSMKRIKKYTYKKYANAHTSINVYITYYKNRLYIYVYETHTYHNMYIYIYIYTYMIYNMSSIPYLYIYIVVMIAFLTPTYNISGC